MSLKIGELFVALGFQVDQAKIDHYNIGLNTTKTKALAVAAAVTAASTAVFKLSDASLKYAVVLKNFALQTGLSIQELEKWRYVAERNDVTGEELIQTIQGIQRAQTEIKLGGGNIRPWQLLGINPDENPFTILEQVREKIKNLDPAMAASIIGQLGIGQNFLNILKAGSLEFDTLNKKFLLTNQEQKNLIKLNRTFKDVIWSIRGLRNRLAAINAEPLTKILKAVKNVSIFTLDAVSSFNKLYKKFKLLKTVTGVAVAGVAAYFFPVTAAIVGTIAILDDLYVHMQGGESVIGSFIEAFELQPVIDDLKEMAPLLEKLGGFALEFTTESFKIGLEILTGMIKDIITVIKTLVKFGSEFTLESFKIGVEILTGMIGDLTTVVTTLSSGLKKTFDVMSSIKDLKFFNDAKAVFKSDMDEYKNRPLIKTPTKLNPSNTINNIEVNVNESSTPAATAKAVMNRIQMQFNDAYFQTPVLGVS